MFWATMSRRTFWAFRAPAVMSIPEMRFMVYASADVAGDGHLQLLQVSGDHLRQVVVLHGVLVHRQELALDLDIVAVGPGRAGGGILGEGRRERVGRVERPRGHLRAQLLGEGRRKD